MAVMQGMHATQECGDCPIRHRAVCARCESEELQALEEIK
ncbi:MAG: transcriptional regulator, partial [Mangrovicoccus sp.]